MLINQPITTLNSSEKTDNQVLDLLTKKVNKIVKEKLTDEEIEKIVDTQSSNKTSVNLINNEIKKTIILETISSLNHSKDEGIKQKINDFVNDEKNLKQFDKILSKNLTNIKKEIKIQKKEIKSYYKRIVTDAEKGFSINDDGEINSKKLSLMIEPLIKEYNELKSSMDAEAKTVLDLKIASTVFITTSVVFGLITTGLTIASFFGVPVAAPAILTGMAAVTFGSIGATLKLCAKSSLNSITKNDELTNKELLKYFFDLASMPYKTIIGNIANVDNLSAGISKISDINKSIVITKEIFKVYSNFNLLVSEILEYVEYSKKINHFLLKLSSLKHIIDESRKIKWVVINELPQDNPYWLNGKGGDNTHFKNLETNEIKTLEEMLQYSDFELYAWNLKRVNGPNGIYLRTLPNSSKEDNLG
ncbi:hypothetical protein [Metamycoplasma neophronis]|uniref:Uncharacterized protein n=1 Tax=Metamycoplasma neophronis TaxID=872983 RepID=A0ABY2Z0Y5_9BACT|nr:hypothetical protein [Metamycoplasma neophronis]TPR54362.1 hypothetical protein FJR74_01135 [Metamycoplasma neophronis]